jgi:NAD(P)-dependent dehydrogenase (short-subunit alcohol dehydrogenase family)
MMTADAIIVASAPASTAAAARCGIPVCGDGPAHLADVTDEAAVQAMLDVALARVSRLDVLPACGAEGGDARG